MASMIEDYALIGDMRSAALISRDGSVDWLCVPRFDSPACFAALLGDDRHGHWSIAPAAVAGAVNHMDGPPDPKSSPAPQSGKPGSARPGEPQIIGDGVEVTRRYRGDSLILETEWHTPAGSIRVTDFMTPRDGQPPVLVRIVEGLSGSVDVSCVCRIRFGYGQVTPWVRRVGSRLLAVAGPDSLWLDTPITLTGRSFAHEATFTVTAGERVPFVLTWVPSHEGAPDRCDPLQAAEVTQRHWDEWVSRCTYRGAYRGAVIRSLITLKALTFQPTGGIVAAATTSLPEDLGGVRNWDYRGSSQLDAAVLLIPEVGFLPPDDPRVVSTVRAVQRELMSDGLVRRYQLAAAGSGQPGPDGLPGSEGAFLACSFWLANALHMIGQDDEATELFERLLSLRNDLGLLSEEYDPRHGRQVGNTPQAFSHVPLIQAALNLDRQAGARSRTADAEPAAVQRHGER